MSTTEASTVLVLDPSTVEVDPDNARKRLTGIPALAQSMKQVGQLVPAVVRRKDGSTDEAPVWVLTAGHRRRAAAIHGDLPLLAIESNGGAKGAALGALAENDARSDLSTGERAKAIQRALDLGATEAEVARSAGRTTKEVRAVRTVAASDAALTAVEKHAHLTLEHGLAIAEFEGDPETQERLTRVAVEDTDYFDHEVARAQRQRAERQKLQHDLDALREAGVRILTEEEAENAIPVHAFLDGKGKALTAKAHKACPGNAAAVDTNRMTPTIVILCTDHEANGHKVSPVGARATRARQAQQQMTPQQREKASKERREVIANNKALDTANGVRRTFVTKLLAQRKAIPGLATFIATAVLCKPGLLDTASTPTWEALTGRKAGKVPGSYSPSPALAILEGCRNDADHLRAVLSLIAAAHESTVTKDSWRHTNHALALYLRFLEAAGYALIDQERMILALADKDAAGKR